MKSITLPYPKHRILGALKKIASQQNFEVVFEVDNAIGFIRPIPNTDCTHHIKCKVHRSKDNNRVQVEAHVPTSADHSAGTLEALFIEGLKEQDHFFV